MIYLKDVYFHKFKKGSVIWIWNLFPVLNDDEVETQYSAGKVNIAEAKD